MSADPQTFGQRIRFYRQRRGLTQAALAAEVGRGHAMLSMVEQGRRQLHVDELVTFARVLAVDPSALLGGEEADRYAEGYSDGYRAALTAAGDALAALSSEGRNTSGDGR